jgi:multidrug transporter EmrE-like cation transporter
MNTSFKILLIVGLAVVALAALVASQIGFKYASGAMEEHRVTKASGDSNNVLNKIKFRILLWFVFAGVTGTLSMILYTLLLRYIPLYVGYALLYGLGFVLIQVVAAKLILKEPVSLLQWLGGAVMVAGIAMIAFGGARG